jgi:hypothetical protein
MLDNPLICEPKILMNCRTKFYKNSCGELIQYQKMVFSQPLFNPFKFNDNLTRYDEIYEKATKLLSDVNPTEKNIERSLRRAKSRLFDLMINNVSECNLFVTLTLDKDVIDRYNYSIVIDHLNTFLSNKVQKNGLKYILVPELHKDGALHFHGIFNKYKGIDLVDSGKKKNGKKIYNILSYKYGFTTAQRITGKNCVEKVSKYVFKYMSKQAGGCIGGRYYLHGGKLAEPVVQYSDEDFSTFPKESFFVTPTLACKIATI